MQYINVFFSNPVIAVITLLGILIFVHEAGHFIVGKACGIAVEIFSIGFGPTLFGFQHKETNYRLSLIPLGGYVKFFGAHSLDEVPESLQGRELRAATKFKRMLTTAAGPLANFLLAILIYAGMGMHGIAHPPPIIGEMMKHSPAEEAGFQVADRFIAINGTKIETWKDLQEKIISSPGRLLKVTVERDNQRLELSVIPEEVATEEAIGQKTRGQIGISPGHIPSIITVTDPNGVAASSGLKTGDRVTAISINSDRRAIKHWDQLANSLMKAAQSGVDSINLEVTRLSAETFHGKANTDNSSSQLMEISLEFSGITKRINNQQDIENALGISSSEVTIASFRDIDDAGKRAKVSNQANSYRLQLRPGDRILRWDNQSIDSIFQLGEHITKTKTSSVMITVERNGKLEDLTVDLYPIEIQKVEGKATMYILPVNFLGEMEYPELVIEKYSFIDSIGYALKKTNSQTWMIGGAVVGLFTGEVPLKALGGPISIGKVASDSVKMGWMTFASALALISINLGLLNLFPIPVLDGGQLVLLFVEALYRKPLPEVAIENYQKVGFVMVLALVVMATYNDLSRFWQSMLQGIAELFQ